MTTFTPSLRFAEMVPGDPAVRNAWGTILDATIGVIEQAIIGNTTINIAGLSTYVLTVANNAPDQSRQQVYPFVGALTADCTVTIPAVPKVGYAVNRTTGGHNVILTAGGLSITLIPGAYTYYFCDGTDVTSPALGGIGSTPIGAGMEFYGTTAPVGWLFPYGQAISRTTYAALFAVLGTTYGAGDGSTTFNMPDLRGRVGYGKDDMGGVAALRITAAGSNLNGVALGAAGGNQLSQQHAHGVTDPGHGHNFSDPGHSHGVTDPTHAHTTGIEAMQTGGGSSGYVGPGHNSAGYQYWNSSYNSTGISINPALTGASIVSHVTGISIQNQFSGNSANLPPGIICNRIIFAGV